MSDQPPDHNAFEHDAEKNTPEQHGACPSFETLSAYADGELASEEYASVHTHIQQCPLCQAMLRDIELLAHLVSRSPVQPPSRSFRLTLETPGLVPPGKREIPLAPMPTPISAHRRVARFYPFATAVAALLLLSVITGDLLSNRGGTPPPVPQSTPAVLYIDGTPYTEEDSNAVHAVGIEPTSVPSTNSQVPVSRDSGSSSNAGSADSDSFWNAWRVVEFVLGLTVAVLLVTMTGWRPFRKRSNPKPPSHDAR